MENHMVFGLNGLQTERNNVKDITRVEKKRVYALGGMKMGRNSKK
jgi:hypothetical protein